MNTSTLRRTTFVTAAAATIFCTASATAGPSPRAVEVLSSRGAAANAELPAHARANSGVRGTLNPSVLNAPEVTLTLADGSTIMARQQRVASDDAKGTQSWLGTFDDSPGSSLVLSKAKGVVTGYANYQDQTLELLPVASGKHVLFAVDSQRLPVGDGVETTGAESADTLASSGDYGLGDVTTTSSGAVVQDVLVLYTAASASAFGQAALESMIQSAVESANQAYLNSQANIALKVVGLQQAPLSESSGMQSTLSALQQNSTVRSLRDKLAADMVVLVSQNSDWCGYAGLWVTTTSAGTNTDAYAVVYSNCLSNQTLAHEIGHLQGLGHDRENEGGTPSYPYAYGYRVCTSDGFRDVMSYACSTNVPRVLQFSNPYVFYNGYATGIAYESNPSKAAEAARALNNNATKVAAYRVGSSSTATPPAAPSALAVQSAVYNKVTICWADNASNENGYKVERSKDGVTFAEVATLGADARSFADGSVTARTTYYYRVRAYNSAGASAYSNTISVATPDIPAPLPAAPTSVVAANNGDGTALVSWAAGSTTATSFEIRRETYNSRKHTWGSATTAAVVPASVTSIADASGSGTFRYSVRATNSGGASAYAGPASVTVTNSTSTSTKQQPPGKGKGG